MAEIIPFQGIHYDQEKIGDLERVVGPPYDVIDAREQNDLYAASPHNFVRIMLNRPEEGDSDTDNPYIRAAGFLREWRKDGILLEDSVPAFYSYRQEFTNPVDGTRKARTGLFCALKLEPYAAGVVLPHEETRTKAKEDRLRLMRATRTNPEPIFGLYEDEEGFLVRSADQAMDPARPLIDVTVEGDRHRVWPLTETRAIAAIQQILRERRVWIADGHHRYETALTYRDERRKEEARVESLSAASDSAGRVSQPRRPQARTGVESRGTANATLTPGPDESRPHTEGGASAAPTCLTPAYDYVLIVLSAFSDPGLVVLPTHRLVKGVPQGRLDELYLQLERYFLVEPVQPADLAARMAARVEDGVHRFGLFMPGRAWTLTLRDETIMDAAVENHGSCWKRLDVSILQTLVLERSLGIPAAQLATTPDVGYTRDRDDAIARVRRGEYQMALLLNLPSADEVRQVAAAGDKMPPKSTFFYPKLWSGLILREV